MSFSPTELEALVRQRAPEIARDITAAAQSARNEADLVAAVERILEGFAKPLDVTLRLDRERTLINGRADAVYNRFVVEYEPPRSLRKEKGARPNQHAIEQVQHYVQGLERLDRHKKERLAGVVLDGSFFIFTRYREGHWHTDDPLPVSAHSTETFLRYLLALSTELALTPENLQRDFGENSNVARQVVPALYAALSATQNPKVQTLFRQWQRQFSEITGYEKGSGQLDLAALARSYALPPSPKVGKGAGGEGLDAERLFFALHTYYGTFIKVLAVQVAQYYLMPKVGSGLGAVASLDSVALRRYLAKMERGGVFADFGIKNFLEGDFFGWYLEIWDEALDATLRRLIGDLGSYSLVTLDVDPEETRDLLKRLYQNLMPKKLRHALGEYYTPDWLAERLLNQLGYDGNPAKRLLDPACGSGTFLVLAIKRVRQYAEDKMLPPGAVLEQVLTNIVGYDLNPLAVISARTNYLLALGELLAERKGEISIPVFLCDSILTPSQGADLFTQGGYGFNTAVGRFSVPRALVSAERIERFAELLEECVEVELAPAQFRQRLAGTFGDLSDDQASLALALYGQLGELARQGINGIWARIIKNAFAPLFQGRFDYVAGNPPWVNWESLPEDYRQETKPLWVHHGLFPHSGMDTILGKGKKDISMLMSYVAMDGYLGDRGRLGFVITQSVFKTAGAGQGFRRFCLGSGTPVGVVLVDDMADLKPFEGAANRTAIVVLERGRATEYPVQYSLWYKPAGGSTIAEDLSLEDLARDKVATYRQFVARPVDEADPTSPWLTGRPRALRAVGKVLGASDYEAKAGVCTWLNSVYWLEIVGQRPDGLMVVSNLTEGAKREVESVQTAIEPDLLYPLLRGRDVHRWQAAPQAHILMVQDPQKRRGYDESWLSVKYPKTYAYLKHFEDILRTRSGYKRYFKESDPFIPCSTSATTPSPRTRWCGRTSPAS
jgi:SAM-dependent methyltransferase